MSKMSSFHLSSSSIKVEDQEAPKVIMNEKQGIVSILGSDCEISKAASSLRRTLSADMSSKKWLAQNGFTFSPMKKIASSEELAISAADHSSSSSTEGEEEFNKRPGQDDVWRSIQSQKEKKEQEGWNWSTILVQKNEDSSKLPPPYIHPLVRKSCSSLSEKSLQICTESLGSETGSDGFSSYTPSEVGDVEEEKDNYHQQQEEEQLSHESFEDMRIVKYNYCSSRKMGPRSFPPPLPSLARDDGVSLHMQSRRQNGRLVLEAVSIPPQNYFHAQRGDGCLRLTFINNTSSQDDEVEEFEQVFDNFEEIEENEAKFDDRGDNGFEEEEEEEEEEEGEEEDEDDEEVEVEVGNGKFEIEKERRDAEFMMEQTSKLPIGLINVHKPTMMVKKLMGLDKKNLGWSPRFNKAVNLIGVDREMEDELITSPPLPQSLPPPPLVTRLISAPPASFNAYEYFWREKPKMATIIKKPISAEQCKPLKDNQNKVILASDLKGNEQRNLVLMRGNKADYLVPLLRGCKDSRSLMLWEPYCIASS
ncbi:hypothetical protein ACH5RR_009616 [Cinchona calisaya]|uniref:FAF domain-containing protein n=1 Tax=Cinchona calisaya TaxID=153742 RepID=A0ABD3AEW5_9GENT